MTSNEHAYIMHPVRRRIRARGCFIRELFEFYEALHGRGPSGSSNHHAACVMREIIARYMLPFHRGQTGVLLHVLDAFYPTEGTPNSILAAKNGNILIWEQSDGFVTVQNREVAVDISFPDICQQDQWWTFMMIYVLYHDIAYDGHIFTIKLDDIMV